MCIGRHFFYLLLCVLLLYFFNMWIEFGIQNNNTSLKSNEKQGIHQCKIYIVFFSTLRQKCLLFLNMRFITPKNLY